MSALLFNHDGWEVLTSAWTVAAKPGNQVQICYQWGADWISWVDSATGIRRINLNVTMSEFVGAVSKGGIVDCRQMQG